MQVKNKQSKIPFWCIWFQWSHSSEMNLASFSHTRVMLKNLLKFWKTSTVLVSPQLFSRGKFLWNDTPLFTSEFLRIGLISFRHPTIKKVKFFFIRNDLILSPISLLSSVTTHQRGISCTMTEKAVGWLVYNQSFNSLNNGENNFLMWVVLLLCRLSACLIAAVTSGANLMNN